MPDSLFTDFSVRALLNGMPPSVRENCILMKMRQHAVVLSQDTPLDSVYLVCRGSVVVEHLREGGIPYDFDEIGVGDFFGEMEAVCRDERSLFTVRALADIEVLRIPRGLFLRWLGEDHGLSLHLVEKLIGKLRYVAFMASEYYYPAVYRVAVYILRAAEIHSEGEFTLPDTREKLAQELGLSVRTVNRSVVELVDRGLIGLYQGKVRLTGVHRGKLDEWAGDIKREYQRKNKAVQDDGKSQ